MATVLAVEDDPANAALITVILRRAGYQVLVEADGRQALQLARSARPAVILLDVSLVGALNGFQVCRALRAEAGTAGIPVVMLSGRAFEAEIEQGRDAGCDDYLPKPFAAQDLLAAVRRVLDPPVAGWVDP